MSWLVAASVILLGPSQKLEAQATYTPYDFTTLAGLSGNSNGPVSSVRLLGPVGVAVDRSGNVYVADAPDTSNANYAVLEDLPAGVVTTLASGERSYIPLGPNTVSAPFGVAVDASGNVYFSDGYSTVQKITNGVVTTLAGTAGVSGNADGTGAAAKFNGAMGIAVDNGGNVYVADAGNGAIRKITPAGVVTTLFRCSPSGVAVDNSGNVYVTDSGDGIILEMTSGGSVTTLAGTPGHLGSADGTGPAAQFAHPSGIAVDTNGNVYVTDQLNSTVVNQTAQYFGNTIRKITQSGIVTTLAGRSGFDGDIDGTGADAQFDSPMGIAVDNNGNVLVADFGNLAIRKVTPGGFVSTVVGINHGGGHSDGIGAAARFSTPTGIAVDNGGNLYVADDGNHTIREIAPSGAVTTLAGTAGGYGSADGTGAAAQFSFPSGVAADGSGNVYVADSLNFTIRKITPNGVVTTFAGTPGVGGSADGTGADALFSSPSGVATDAAGNVYVADTGNSTIRKITPSGVVTTLAGNPAAEGSADGTGAGAQFRSPEGVAVDSSGNVYVADTYNSTIRKITPGGVVTTLAGNPAAEGSADGTGALAQFNQPYGVAVDSSGNVYVADTNNSTVRKITPTGSVTTLAGVPDFYFAGGADGMGASARFYRPMGVAVDMGGNVFLADSGNNTIRIGAYNHAPSLASEPSFSSLASTQTVASGGTVVFSVSSASMPAPSYQWSFDGVTIPGATDPTLLVPNATAANSGDYYCTATNSLGLSVSSAVLTVVDTTNPGRLINLSCRSLVSTDANVLIVGFVVGGSGTSGSETLLVRASGPALVPFGVSGVLPDPGLQLISSNTLVAANNGWGGSSTISKTAAAVGAFPWFDYSSHDSALVETLPTGPYTALVAGASGDSGIALAELYDATPAGAYSPSTPRLINISARTQVGQGANVLIAGFVIAGTTSKTVLIRASGPALVPFGVSGVLPDPQLQLNNSAGAIATNTGWGGDAQIASTAASVGAFSWGTTATADSALLVTLLPGAYTAEVSGASGDTGIALVEVYEVQ
jgi:sugar lactone lactonase YvrE